MFTWKRDGEADFAHGTLELPKQLLIGGDFRFLSLYKDNKVTETKVGIPMQADIEFAYQPTKNLTVAAALGSYDGNGESRRHYVLYQGGENLSARVGRFFPAFGIYTPDHSILTRKFLGFNQGQETYNAEFAWITQQFELIGTGMSGSASGEGISPRDDGFAVRTAWALGGRSQIGFSYLRGEGALWQRDVYGPFLMLSLTERLYIHSELDLQARRALDSSDPSLPTHRALVSYTRCGWEFTQGLHLLATVETLDTLGGSYVPQQRAYGPGLQWFPRPHLEFLAKVEKRLDEAYSQEYGDQAMLVSHYYF
jgi:hypothetical protein